MDTAPAPAGPYRTVLPGFLPADLTDLGEAFEAMVRFRPAAVVHLAAIATPFSRSDAFTYRVNTQLAFNVLEAAAGTGVGRVVVASSPTVVGYGAPGGWVPRYLPLDEDHPSEPWNAYSLSKLAAEEAMRTFARTGGDRSRYAAFRPCFVVAPEDWEGAPTQTGHTIRERLDDVELSGRALFNYVDGRDAAELVLRLLHRLPDIPSGEVFYAGAADALAREPLADLLPAAHPGTAGHAKALTGTTPAFSIAKAQRLLGWHPRHSWRDHLD
ncbi:nucleoside-diphosphate-sugar epimerase [Allostreptomyces psammosilenae]|uniref:Nucleoside-diphosphate-sugar epimerase n=1 Tax=Allostreptomyces psammosilenae TaxID=1892865 RepID=A0A852ZPL8_9ACTN|nr:nucleoside-diphosphate-sugar epimerase [Allostreptomyces psammosilenae]